jgi:melibiose permease
MYPCFSDVIDEIVIKTAARKEGIYTGIRTFFGRLSNIIGPAIIMVVHISTGFVAGAPTQTGSALFGIRVIMGLVPMIFYIVSFLLMWRVYDLTPQKLEEIQETLESSEL